MHLSGPPQSSLSKEGPVLSAPPEPEESRGPQNCSDTEHGDARDQADPDENAQGDQPNTTH